MDDPYGLERFAAAQDDGGTYQRAVAELRAGAKRGHWMWFVFPQVAGLGFSAMSQRYAIASLAEAGAYLAHPVLGPRLVDCARILAATEGKPAAAIFGDIDAMKLRSSMTLFMTAAPDEQVFREVLQKYFDGHPDNATLERLALLVVNGYAVLPDDSTPKRLALVVVNGNAVLTGKATLERLALPVVEGYAVRKFHDLIVQKHHIPPS